MCDLSNKCFKTATLINKQNSKLKFNENRSSDV